MNAPSLSEQNNAAALTARILNEALPYLQRYTGQTVVIKYGGNETLKRSFAQNVVMMIPVGVGEHQPRGRAWRWTTDR